MQTEPCPKCRAKGGDASGDNLVTHPEHGYKKCFKCDHFESINSLLHGKYLPVADRGLNQETCEKMGIQIVSYTGKFYVGKEVVEVTNHRCAALNYYDKGKLVKQKLRSLSHKKYMKVVGDTKFSALFGKQAYNPTQQLPIVITEGEFDAAAVYQSTGLPAVSIPNGTGSINVLVQELEWLQGWKHVVLMFDNDEAGKDAVSKAISLLPVGRVRIASLPLKDANEMLMQGKDIKPYIWNAEIHKPSTIVSVKDIMDKIKQKPIYGMSLPYDFLNKGMYGLQPNHLYTIIGFSKVGKTEFLKELIYHLIDIEKTKVGIFSLEQGAASTMQRMVATFLQKPLHLPSNEWWDEGIIEEKALEFEDKIKLYDNSSNESLSIETLLINIRYMYYCYGIKVVILDNLTAMCTNPIIDGKIVSDDVYTAHIMKKLFALTRELPLSIILVAHIYESKLNRQIHIPTSVENKKSYLAIAEKELDKMLNKPGLDWASGRMPGLADVHKMVGRMSDYVLGLARNTVSTEESERRILRVKFLATRLGSEYSGREMQLMYNYETGRYECPQTLT